MKKPLILIAIMACAFAMFRFPHVMVNPGELVEGHQNIKNDCSSCHTIFKGISTEKCISCHKLSEIGLNDSDNIALGDKHTLFHQNLAGQECTMCHTDHAGTNPEKQVRGFTHDMLGIDIRNNCSVCHSPKTDTFHTMLSKDCGKCHNFNGWKPATFNHDMLQTTATNCISCHKKPTANTLHNLLPDDCGKCHNFNGWKQATFNHDMLQTSVTNCVSCHKKPADTYHAKFAENCTQCHSTSKWVPSTFDHSKYFLLDNKHNAQCITCHTNNNFSAYTCYGCHEHSEGNIAGEHREEGITNFSNCVSCHKSGNEHDIRNSQQNGENENYNKSEKNKKESKHKSEEEDDD